MCNLELPHNTWGYYINELLTVHIFVDSEIGVDSEPGSASDSVLKTDSDEDFD